MFWQLWVVAGMVESDLVYLFQHANISFQVSSLACTNEFRCFLPLHQLTHSSSANCIFKDVPRIAWRLQLGSACLPSLILMIGIYFCPESVSRVSSSMRNIETDKNYSHVGS
jgi:hypothetical protein